MRSPAKLNQDPLFSTTLLSRSEIEQVAFPREAVTVEQIDLHFLERRSHFVLYDFDLRPVADDLVAIFDSGAAPHFHANRGVELQSVAAGGRLGIAEHDADLLAQLVDEDEAGVGARDLAGELSQSLRHQPRLQADVAVAHLAFEFGPGYQCRD